MAYNKSSLLKVTTNIDIFSINKCVSSCGNKLRFIMFLVLFKNSTYASYPFSLNIYTLSLSNYIKTIRVKHVTFERGGEGVICY